MRLTVGSLVCPVCGISETVEGYPNVIFIQGFKELDKDGHWWSQCLVCSFGWAKNESGIWIYDESNYNPDKGWF